MNIGKRITALNLAMGFGLFLLSILVPAQPARAALESGVPFATWVEALTLANIDIEVPEGATRLTVSTSEGSGDLDLYLKYGSPVSGGTLSAIDADADIRSDGPGADETITLTPSSSPALQAGKWYIATLNLNNSKTYFTLTATIENVPAPVDFGIVIIGDIARKSIRINNPGSTTVNIDAITVSGDSAALFEVSRSCSSIAVGSYCDIEISFAPVAPGLANAQINLYSNGGKIPSLVSSLSGYGVFCEEIVLPLPTEKNEFPAYQALAAAVTSNDPASCRPLGMGPVAGDGETVVVEIKTEKPSGSYDAYLALEAPAIAQDEFFLLGEDGVFHPYSQCGLVKWKNSASEAIDARPFGEFPVASLPGGDYRFNFLLTPAGTLKSYYLWSSGFSVSEPEINVPDGSAGYFNGTLIVPNATIIYQGQLCEGSSPLADDGIAAIKKDGKIYLYHPALGQAELSDYNTRRAVGYFVTGLSASEIAEMRERAKAEPSPEALPESQAVTRNVLSQVGQCIEMGTGIELELLDENGSIKATNTRRRWAVVKTGPENKDKYFLVPRKNLLPTELIDQIQYVNKVQVGQLLGGSIFDVDTVRYDIKATGSIETFGAFDRDNQPRLTDNQLQALEKDFELTCLLNALNMTYTNLEFARNICGIIPLECADFFTNTLFRYYQSALVRDKQVDLNARLEIDTDFFKSGASSVMVCIGEVYGILAPPVAFLIEIYSSTSDIFSLFQYILEDRIIENIWRGEFDAYDSAILGMEKRLAYLQRDQAGTKRQIVHDLERGFTEVVPFPADQAGINQRIVDMTLGGVILSYLNSSPAKVLTTQDWGTGFQTDIHAACGGSGILSLYNEQLDISDAGRLFFRHGVEIENSAYYTTRRGIYSLWDDGTDGHFVPIVINQQEYDWHGYDDIIIDALCVSGDGRKLFFSTTTDHEDTLYVVSPDGGAPQALATSESGIEFIRTGASGNVVLFDYTTPENESTFCTIPSSGGAMIDLATNSYYTFYRHTANISPDGNWVAVVTGNLDYTLIGITFLRSDGSELHFVNTGSQGVIPHTTLPVDFSTDNKTVVFSAYHTEKSGIYDIYSVENDREMPNLTNLTDTPEFSETFPLIR